MSRKRAPVTQHVKDGLVTEVQTPYHLPHILFEHLEEDEGCIVLCRSRLHLSPLEHHALIREAEVKRTRLSIQDTGFPIVAQSQHVLPWTYQCGYVLIVRKADGQTRLIPGSYEYLREIGLRIGEEMNARDRAHSLIQIGILVCCDPRFPEIHSLSDQHVPMPGYRIDWDVILRQDVVYRSRPTHL
jgi:hypothetical protein